MLICCTTVHPRYHADLLVQVPLYYRLWPIMLADITAEPVSIAARDSSCKLLQVSIIAHPHTHACVANTMLWICCALAACCRVLRGPNSTEQYAQPAVETLAAAAAAESRGCAVQVADNSTLVPTLVQKAAVRTQQPLLVIIPFNVSLGRGLPPGAIQIRRCVPWLLFGVGSR
jgi:hypothetical protein